MTPADLDRAMLRAVVLSIVGLAGAWVIYEIRSVLLLLYVSSLLAIGLSPVVARIERGRIGFGRLRAPRWLAILIIYVAFLIVAGLIVAVSAPPLVAQGHQLLQNLPGYADHAQQFLADRGLLRPRWSWSDVLTNLQAPSTMLTNVLGAVQGALGVFGTVVTVLMLPFYFLLESSALRAGFLRLFAADQRAQADRVARAVTITVGAWLGGQLLLAGIIGLSATLGFWLIGVPYFYVLGAIAAVGEMIPVVGPIVSAVPAILVGLTVSPQTALVVALYCWAQQFIENNVLVPRVMERQLGLSPVTVIVALLIGSTLLGLAGAILAVPTAAIIQAIVQEYRPREHAAAPPDAP